MTPYAYDPGLQVAAEELPIGGGLHEHVSDRRTQIAPFMSGSEIGGVAVRTHMLTSVARTGTEAGTSVRIDVFTPPSLRPTRSAGLLYLPGGGFVIPPQPGTERATAALASRLGVPIVMLHYRLAPENPFPAALFDAVTAFDWMTSSATPLKIDPALVGLLGDSAGGGLAASLTMFLRDRRDVQPLFQHLTMPMLDDRTASESMRTFTDTPLWTGPDARQAWAWYLPKASRQGALSQYASPAKAASVAGLPPARIVTAEFDPLRDEGIAYAQRLIASGIPTELHHYPGTFHGSQLVRGADVSTRMARDRIEALRRAFGLETPGRAMPSHS